MNHLTLIIDKLLEVINDDPNQNTVNLFLHVFARSPFHHATFKTKMFRLKIQCCRIASIFDVKIFVVKDPKSSLHSVSKIM